MKPPQNCGRRINFSVLCFSKTLSEPFPLPRPKNIKHNFLIIIHQPNIINVWPLITLSTINQIIYYKANIFTLLLNNFLMSLLSYLTIPNSHISFHKIHENHIIFTNFNFNQLRTYIQSNLCTYSHTMIKFIMPNIESFITLKLYYMPLAIFAFSCFYKIIGYPLIQLHIPQLSYHSMPFVILIWAHIVYDV